MIQVQVKRNAYKQLQSVQISGHADSGPFGYDLVCAGVSAVTFGAINAIEELCHVELVVVQEEDGGYLLCSVPDSIQQHPNEHVYLLLEGMISSLKTIEAAYSEHIQIND